MNENPKEAERIHSEAPAEGDETADPRDIRMHSQDPAEGADIPGADIPGADVPDEAGTEG